MSEPACVAPLPPPRTAIFDSAGMASRRAAYFAHVRDRAAAMFHPDGSYRLETEPDGRIAYWVLPAFLAADDGDEREWGLRVYAAGAGWDAFDIFMTSSVAAHLARHYDDLTPELRQRSEEHLARFAVAGAGRLPSADVYDYMFHGFNDNMPAMATRTLLLAGDLLGRGEFTDAGLFRLEGLAAHFQRRGLLSEYTSPTYTPICLCSLLDIAECSANREARELAQACADRVLLDILGHWHGETGSSGGTTARAYTVDVTQTLSVLNAYMWYVSGSPLTIDPRLDGYDGPMHHGRNLAFNLAQFVEVMNATHAGVRSDLQEFAWQPRTYPYTIRATSDWAGGGDGGGCRGVQTRSFQQPGYWLATSSTNNTGANAGQSLLLHGALAAVPEPTRWRDRVAFLTRLIADSPDYGDAVHVGASPHAGGLAHRQAGAPAEADHVNDWGRYQTVQQGGSAMLVGGISPDLDGREVKDLHFSFLATAFCRLPDEMSQGDRPLAAWEGEVTPHRWQFLRYGDVYLGLRFSAMAQGARCPVRRELRGGYLRLGASLLAEPRRIDRAFREWADVGCLVEIGSRAEAGSFAEFRRTVQASTWEFHHNFYRSSRWLSRNGELQIVDSPLSGTARFVAVDGVVEPETHLAATGLDPALTRLFADGRQIRQRRALYRPDTTATPFYNKPGQILEKGEIV